MTEDTASVPPGWEGIFAPGEQILWQGRPDGAFNFPVTDVPKLLPHVIGFGIGMALMLPVASRGGWLFLLPVLLILLSLWALARAVFSDTKRRRASHYTLSNRAGYIALDGRKRVLESYPLTAQTEVYLAPLSDGLGSVLFGIRSEKIGKDRRKMLAGFERIAEPETVFARVKSVQEGRA